MAYNQNKTRTWDQTTPADGNLFEAEFNRVYENTRAVREGDGFTPNTINANILLDGSIATAKVADAGITTAKIQDASITEGKLGDASISTAKLQDGSVTEGKYADSSIATSKLKDLAVTDGKIAAGTISESRLIADLAAKLIPIGTVISSARATPPSGFLLCDGSELSRTVYASLFAELGVVFGAGDGVNTFNIPDLRGVFIRGVGTSQGFAFNPTIALGERLDDQLEDHTHNYNAPQVYSEAESGAGNVSRFQQTWESTIPVTGKHGSETRPKSVGLNKFIKY